MAKTTSRKTTGPTKGARPKSRQKRVAPKPWYQRIGPAPWILAAAVAVVVVFALVSGGGGSDAPEEPTALPVVGGDLHSLVSDPTDPSRLFIGSHSGVSVSADEGETWEVVESLNGADAMGWAFTDDAIYVGGHPGLYTSIDGGETFEQRNEGLPNTDIHALGAGAGAIYAASPGAGFIASTDGGESWEVRNEQVGQGFMGQMLVDPSDADHVIAPDMQSGAVETTDGGKTWEVLGGAPGAMWVSWNPEDTDDIVVTATGSAARSTDGGKSWDAMQIPPGASIVEFSAHDPQTLYAAVHDDPNARVFVSTDGGQTWDRP